MKGRCSALAMQFEAQVDCGDDVVYIRNAVYDKPAGKGVAAPPLAEPIEAAARGIVEWVAHQVTVVPWLELTETKHGLEIAPPVLISGNSYGEVIARCADGNQGVGLGVSVGLAGADKVTDITLKVDVVAGRRG